MLNLKIHINKFYTRYKNSLLFASASFIVQGINAFTLPLFTRLLTQADYGILSASNSVESFSTAVFRLGTQQSILKQYSEFNDNEKQHYLFSVIFFSLLWAIFLFGIIIGINFFLDLRIFENVDFYPYLTIAILTSAFSTSYALFQSYLRILNIAQKFIIITVSYFLLNITISIFLIVIYDLGALGKLLGGLLPYLLIFVFIVIKTFSKFKLKYWLDAIRFGYPLAISSIIFSIVMIYTVSYLSSYVSLQELGIYHIGKNLGLLIPDFLFQSLILTYQPFIYDKLREKKMYAITKQNSLLIVGLLISILVTGILGKLIILIFTTNEYLEALLLMRLFLLSYVFRIVYFFPMVNLFYNNMTFLYTKIELFALSVFLVSIHFFVPWLSIEGIGAAIIIQELVKMILIVYYSKIPLNQIFNLNV